MELLPTSWPALCALSLLLGARHGLDADHLATIDALTRFNAGRNHRLARRAGTLFSLGHGAIVMAVALATAGLASRFEPPAWLEPTGAAISVAFLLGLAFANVRAVLASSPDEVVAIAGAKARLIGRLRPIDRAWPVAAIGALFALSFDTVSQAALFAVIGGRFGGVAPTLVLAALFVIGMVAVDGINGVWISKLVRRADRTAVVASRVMALSIAGLALAVGVLAIVQAIVPAVDAWVESLGLAMGATVVGAVMAAFLASMVAARRRARLARG